MKRALLDTDILSEITKAKSLEIVGRARAYLAFHGRFTFSAVSVMEVVAGYSKQRAEQKTRRFLEMVDRSEVLSLDATSAELAGRILADLQTAGTPIGVPDTMIAATAIRHGIPLVTGNTSDYLRVQAAGYSLVMENWREPT
ncbi:twitching motility protein PilT [Sorangium cellulosum]|uniref:Ribonuclease VapC n=1 Tax=Sorangium cellulosum TaxID=56 RepID=A0A2L0EZP2_SORCE|nr:PIN domain-containing protein [Sorangium cellulosum]AUX44753.1 twitching motility protein PilT [Sorangium cellulosum]